MSIHDVTSDEPLVQRARMPDELRGKLVPVHRAFKRVPPNLKVGGDCPRTKRRAAKRPRLGKFINVKIKQWQA